MGVYNVGGPSLGGANIFGGRRIQNGGTNGIQNGGTNGLTGPVAAAPLAGPVGGGNMATFFGLGPTSDAYFKGAVDENGNIKDRNALTNADMVWNYAGEMLSGAARNEQSVGAVNQALNTAMQAVQSGDVNNPEYQAAKAAAIYSSIKSFTDVDYDTGGKTDVEFANSIIERIRQGDQNAMGDLAKSLKNPNDPKVQQVIANVEQAFQTGNMSLISGGVDNGGTNKVNNGGTNVKNGGTNVENGGTNVKNGGTNVKNGGTNVENGGTNVENGGTNVNNGGTNVAEKAKSDVGKAQVRMQNKGGGGGAY